MPREMPIAAASGAPVLLRCGAAATPPQRSGIAHSRPPGAAPQAAARPGSRTNARPKPGAVPAIRKAIPPSRRHNPRCPMPPAGSARRRSPADRQATNRRAAASPPLAALELCDYAPSHAPRSVPALAPAPRPQAGTSRFPRLARKYRSALSRRRPVPGFGLFESWPNSSAYRIRRRDENPNCGVSRRPLA